MKFIFSIIVLLALAANHPCLAKEAHAQHGARAGAVDKGASAKGASVKASNPAETKSNAPVDAERALPPPVLPPQGVTPQRNRTINPGVKISPANVAHSQTETTMPAVRNAIGQPVRQPKNFVGTQPQVPPAQQPSGAAPTIGLRGASPAAPPVVSSNPAHANAPAVNVATAANRGSVNGAALIRPAAAPTTIGGAVRPNYGINGTTVQNKH